MRLHRGKSKNRTIPIPTKKFTVIVTLSVQKLIHKLTPITYVALTCTMTNATAIAITTAMVTTTNYYSDSNHTSSSSRPCLAFLLKLSSLSLAYRCLGNHSILSCSRAGGAAVFRAPTLRTMGILNRAKSDGFCSFRQRIVAS